MGQHFFSPESSEKRQDLHRVWVWLTAKSNRQILFSILILACLTILIYLPIGDRRIPLRKSFEDFPTLIGQWNCAYGKDNETIPTLTQAYHHLAREYRDRAGHKIRLYAGYFEKQTEGREAMVGIRGYLGERFAGWQVVNQKVDMLDIPGYSKKGGIKVSKCIIQNGPRRHLILYWYQICGKFTFSRYRAKLLLVLNTILRNRRDGAFICLSVPVATQTLDISQKNVADFGKLIIPILARYLPE